MAMETATHAPPIRWASPQVSTNRRTRRGVQHSRQRRVLIPIDTRKMARCATVCPSEVGRRSDTGSVPHFEMSRRP